MCKRNTWSYLCWWLNLWLSKQCHYSWCCPGLCSGSHPDVAIFLDGIYLQRQSMANVGMIDMQRIEVVKGPQSSLYGRNAFSGLIAYTIKKPTEETTGYVSTTQGDNDRQDYQGRISGSLIEEKMLGSFTYGTSKYDGHTENEHPFAKANPSGFSDGSGDGLLGGYDDRTYNLGLQFNINDALTLSSNYYNTEQLRETQPAYIVGGAREVAVFATTPYGDMNSNPIPISSVLRDNNVSGNTNTVAYGNTVWKGRLPTDLKPGKYIGFQYYDPAKAPADWTYSGVDFGFGNGATPSNQLPDARVPGAVSDPRTVGVKAETEITDMTLAWAINDDCSKFTYGYVNHTGFTGGEAERDPLYGSFVNDVDPRNFPDGTKIVDQEIQTNAFSSRPIIDTSATSYESRFEWAGNDIIDGSFGFYYSKVDDRAYDQTTYAPICSNRYPKVDGVNQAIDLDQPDQSAGCYQAVDTNTNLYDNTQPLNQARSQFIYGLFRDYWSGSESNDTIYNDHIRSAFAATNIKLLSDVRLRLEGRFTEERRRIDRQSDQFGLSPGEIAYLDKGLAPFTGEGRPLYEYILINNENKGAGVTGYGYPSGGCAPGTDETTYAALVQNSDVATTLANKNVILQNNGKDAQTVKTVKCIPQTSSDTTSYFAPRIGLDWEISIRYFPLHLYGKRR